MESYQLKQFQGMATNPLEGLSEAPRLLKNLTRDRLGGYRPWGHKVSNPLAWSLPDGVLHRSMPWGHSWIRDTLVTTIGVQYLDDALYTRTLSDPVYINLNRELPGLALGNGGLLGLTTSSSIFFLQDSSTDPPAIEHLGDVWAYYSISLSSANLTGGQWSDTNADTLTVRVYPVIATPHGKFAGPYRTVSASVAVGDNAFQLYLTENTTIPDKWTGHLEFWIFATDYLDVTVLPTPDIFTLLDIYAIGYQEHNPGAGKAILNIIDKPPVGTDYLDAVIDFHGDAFGARHSTYYKQRFFWTGSPGSKIVPYELGSHPSSGGVQPVTERPKSPSKIYWTDPVDLHIHRVWAWIENPTAAEGEPLTGMVGTSFGLLIFSSSNCWVFDGDFQSVQGTRLQKYPTPVGHDIEARTAPVAFSGGAISIWNGQLWEISGGQSSHVSQPVFDPLDPFVGVAVDSVNGDLLAQTANGRLYRFDAQTKTWSLIEDFGGTYHPMLYDPETFGVIIWKEGSNQTLGWKRAKQPTDSTDVATIRFENLDFGAPNVWKQFRRVFLFIPKLTDPTLITVTGEIDSQPFTSAPAYFDHRGYFSVGLPPYVGTRLTLELSLAAGNFASVGFRPPIEIEYRLVRKR